MEEKQRDSNLTKDSSTQADEIRQLTETIYGMKQHNLKGLKQKVEELETGLLKKISNKLDWTIVGGVVGIIALIIKNVWY